MSGINKPSLNAIAVENEGELRSVASKVFGMPVTLDSRRFEDQCFAARLEVCKRQLCEINPEHQLAIGACSTPDDLRALIERADIIAPHNARALAAEGGRLFRIDDVSASSTGGLTLNWSAAGIGFGQATFYVGKEDGRLHVDPECMGRHFVRSLLVRLADELVIDGDA